MLDITSAIGSSAIPPLSGLQERGYGVFDDDETVLQASPHDEFPEHSAWEVSGLELPRPEALLAAGYHRGALLNILA